MTAIATEDSWMETCFVSISLFGGSEIPCHAYTETVDIDRGEKQTEGKPLASGGRLTTWTPEGDTTVTLEAYFLESGNAKGVMDLLSPASTPDTTQPLRISNSRLRSKARIALLWTNDTTATTAVQATAANASARRMAFANGHIVSVKDSFTDGVLKSTVVFKTSAFDKTGATGQVMDESVDGTSTLPALAAYASLTSPFA